MTPNVTALMQELLIETALFYNSGNRSVIASRDGGCAYRDDKGNGCAIGRILTDATIEELIRKDRNTAFSGRRVIEVYGPEAFLEKWRPIVKDENGKTFLNQLQALHDCGGNWTEKGISSSGEDYVRFMVSVYHLDLHAVLDAIEEKMSK